MIRIIQKRSLNALIYITNNTYNIYGFVSSLLYDPDCSKTPPWRTCRRWRQIPLETPPHQRDPRTDGDS
jgi:hypothetical protein